jgi:alkylation response protein AidB-like acyl-CoA dehydrogenase
VTGYQAPVRDIAFALDVVGVESLTDRDTVVELVSEFGRFCAEVIAPLNQAGDVNGVAYDPSSGAVATAPGWREAYARYVDAGWNSVSFDEEFGGGGFPWLVTTAMQEELNASSMAFALCPMLTQGAVHLFEERGTPEQQGRYLPKLLSGEWTGTMNLTEPAAGSDLGALTTRAEPDGDGGYRIYGQKIFITYGEHDLTDQIVHLVLARLPDGPPGVKGISCFVVPKVLTDGSPNGVRCIGIEHKMGIHASPTCTLEFDGAVGELIGGPHEGMRSMFIMMNTARLSVGVEGLGAGVRAYQDAVAYAKERVQGRVVGGPAGAPILEHPDVRRMVLHMRSHVEAMRLLAYRTAVAIDADDSGLADLLTPVTKAWCTDVGGEVAHMAVQAVGGMGYIRETGLEQHERDVRIAAIYEGTNGIQAIDLVGRKLNLDGGAPVKDLLTEMESTAAEAGGRIQVRLTDAVRALAEATEWLQARWAEDPRQALAGATPYLRMFGTTAAGWLLARQAISARAGADDDAFLAAKVTSAEFFCDQIVPQVAGLLPSVLAGATELDAIPAELL